MPEIGRDSLRDTKCLLPLNTTSDLLNSLEDLVERSAMIYSQAAFELSQSLSSNATCPYAPQELAVVPFCSKDGALSFSGNEAFSENVEVSFGGIGVIGVNSTLEDLPANEVTEIF